MTFDYFRHCHICVPALRERRADIITLHIIGLRIRKYGISVQNCKHLSNDNN